MCKIRKDKDILTGRTFGYLQVISPNLEQNDTKHSYWNCLCKCGQACIKRADALKTTPVPSCGCHKREATSKQWSAELSGQKFGKLTVIKRIDTGNVRATWECLCDCGTICYLPSRYLLACNVKSCGCETRSKGELWARAMLTESDYTFKEQFTFPDCVSSGGRLIKFDFAVFLHDTLVCLVEINGDQHYRVVDYFGGIERFEQQKLIDQIKRNYCTENNIYLLEIPYEQVGKIDLLTLIQEVRMAGRR